MRSFITRRIRNVAALKIGISVAIALIGFFAIAAIVSAIISTIVAPIEAVKNVVVGFFDGDDSAAGEDEIDLRTCLAVDPTALGEVLTTVPPLTEIETARQWITLRAEEIASGTEPTYDSIITYLASPAAQNSTAFDTTSDADPSRYDLAAIAGVIALVERGVLVAPDDDTLTNLSAALVEHCSA